jgi:hypothetical protein
MELEAEEGEEAVAALSGTAAPLVGGCAIRLE